MVAEISVSTRCNQRTTPIAAIRAPFRPLRQLHPRVTHWRGTLNSVSLPWIARSPCSPSLPFILLASLLRRLFSFHSRSLDSVLLLCPRQTTLSRPERVSFVKLSSGRLLLPSAPVSCSLEPPFDRARFRGLRAGAVMRTINGRRPFGPLAKRFWIVCCGLANCVLMADYFIVFGVAKRGDGSRRCWWRGEICSKFFF